MMRTDLALALGMLLLLMIGSHSVQAAISVQLEPENAQQLHDRYIAQINKYRDHPDLGDKIIFDENQVDFHFSLDHGWRLMAKKGFKSGAKLVQMPLHLVLHTQHILSSAVRPAIAEARRRDHPEEKMALLMIYERFVNKTSEFRPMLESIPMVDHPTMWSKEELAELPMSMQESVLQLREEYAERYAKLFPKLSRLFPDLCPPDAFTFDNYVWAMTNVVARGQLAYLNFQPAMTMAPVIEKMRFGGDFGNAAVNVDVMTKVITLNAVADIKPGDEIRFRGAWNNRNTLMSLGLVLPTNSWNGVQVDIDFTPATDALFLDKLQCTKAFDKEIMADASLSWFLRDNGKREIEPDLAIVLRCIVLTRAEVYAEVWKQSVSNMRKAGDGMISEANEWRMYKRIRDAAVAKLAEYADYDLESDSDALMMDDDMPRHKQQALLIRHEEMKLLHLHISICDTAMAKLPTPKDADSSAVEEALREPPILEKPGMDDELGGYRRVLKKRRRRPQRPADDGVAKSAAAALETDTAIPVRDEL